CRRDDAAGRQAGLGLDACSALLFCLTGRPMLRCIDFSHTVFTNNTNEFRIGLTPAPASRSVVPLVNSLIFTSESSLFAALPRILTPRPVSLLVTADTSGAGSPWFSGALITRKRIITYT